MLLFDYECPNCGIMQEHFVKLHDEAVSCNKCGTPMRKLITMRNTRDWFPEGGMWMEHIAEHPIFVTSKRHLKQECEKHDCYSIALLNENKGTGTSQEIASNSELGWRKSKEPRKVKEVVNESYRRVFGDV